MPSTSAQKLIEQKLSLAGVATSGARPWDIKVLNQGFYQRVLAGGSLAFGESYMDGWWDCEQLDEMIARLFKADVPNQIPLSFSVVTAYLRSLVFNLSSPSRAFQIGEKHYDMGNDLFSAMLDRRMIYSCGYWQASPDFRNGFQPQTLDDAQEAKLDLICRKMGLQKGQKVLDIGCGWGGLAKYMAQNYGCSVVGVTVSKEQAQLAREVCASWPVEIRLQDYRQLNEPFDHIVSVGMFEHVGYKNYRTYMEVVRRCLKDGGIFLLHTIGGLKSVKQTNPWIDKYIFPNSMLPSISQIAKAAEGLFVIEDWHNFGPDYEKTLMAWYANFEKAWPALREKYGPRFYRMWRFYLLSCAGIFRARHGQLWQAIFSKEGVKCGYKTVR
ncbi:cyclopropane fatty acyl phospholipid synthase [Candidatus Uhrbacteria bacterium]|nr:cyclopropane fatty acyl phospholipid synthase [Candidatus Uhrbacteria bacterium]